MIKVGQFSMIIYKGLDNLTNLQLLSLSKNSIERIEGLDNLTNLQLLDLSKNSIERIEGLDNLTNLNALDLGKNRIEDLLPLFNWLKKGGYPVFWESLDWDLKYEQTKDESFVSLEFELPITGKLYLTYKKGLYLKGCNHLKLPSPEWIQQGTRVVMDYLEAAVEQGTVTMNEAKVMIVGRPHAGKTSASIKLRNSNGKLPKSTDSTKGIEVKDWNFAKDGINYIAHVWDFGGQDVQYAIHQFFMTQRSVYLLVDCTRDPEKVGETRSEIISNYWLEIIKILAKSSPTFYLYNLYESYSKNLSVFHNLQRLYDFLYEKPFEVDLNKISKSNEQGILPVRNQLQEAIKSLPNVGLVLPAQWAAVKEKLTEEAKQHSFITLERYFDICSENNIRDKKSALLISRYFHEIGSIIHYSDDESSALYKLVILNRTWATEATYKVVLDKNIEKQGGRFTKVDAQRIWSKTTYKDKTQALMELLERFEICYELANSHPKTYLIPQCLPDVYPENIDENLENPLSIRYDYGFLPYGIINRLTVRLHKYIYDSKVWKKGMILQKEAGRVVVEEVKNINKGYIEIRVSGDKKNRWYLQERVMEEIDDLNKTFNMEERASIQVPCICDFCKDKEDPYLHDYKTLIKMLGKKIDKSQCQNKLGNFDMVNILDLIDHVFFERPEAVTQSLSQNPLDFSGAHIEKFVMGDDKSKAIEVKAKDKATVQVAELGGKNIHEGLTAPPINFWEYFRVRKLIGWAVGASAAAIVAYNIPPLRAWAGLIFTGIIGWGFYRTLTSVGKYMRYSKWVLIFGMGAAGILNGLPVIAGNFEGQIGIGRNIIHFLGQWTMDEQPLITLVILLLTFLLSFYLVYKDKDGE